MLLCVHPAVSTRSLDTALCDSVQVFATTIGGTEGRTRARSFGIVSRESLQATQQRQTQATTPKMVLYGLVKNMPKSQAIGVTISGAIALSYGLFAFQRYTGASIPPSSLLRTLA